MGGERRDVLVTVPFNTAASAGLVIKQNFWIWTGKNISGNAIFSRGVVRSTKTEDFLQVRRSFSEGGFMKVEGKSFATLRSQRTRFAKATQVERLPSLRSTNHQAIRLRQETTPGHLQIITGGGDYDASEQDLRKELGNVAKTAR